MKRSLLLCLSGIVLYSSMLLASTGPKRYAVTEGAIIGMLVLSLGTIAGGLVIRNRKKDWPTHYKP